MPVATGSAFILMSPVEKSPVICCIFDAPSKAMRAWTIPPTSGAESIRGATAVTASPSLVFSTCMFGLLV